MQDGSSLEIQVVGPECAGKSLLVKNLKLLCESATQPSSESLSSYCNPTVGVDIVDITINGHMIPIREMGSAISSRWASFYSSASALMIVIDVADISNWANAAICLAEVAAYRSSLLKEKPTLVVLNRAQEIDEPEKSAAVNAIGLNQLPASWPSSSIVAASVADIDGLQKIVRWIETHVLQT